MSQKQITVYAYMIVPSCSECNGVDVGEGCVMLVVCVLDIKAIHGASILAIHSSSPHHSHIITLAL